MPESERGFIHCCVPLCSASAKFNGILSFHAFPTHSDLRRQWLVNIRRDHFTITSHTRVCCRHFASDQLIEPTTLDGRRRLIKGAVPTLFEWNGYKVEPPRRSVWERTEQRPELVPPDDQEEHSLTRDHDYCSVPEPSALDISASAAEDLSKDVETLRKEIQDASGLHVQKCVRHHPHHFSKTLRTNPTVR
uniref:THAP domain-containing protein 1 n=1 Tax=Maylandia zebra TaxID=106582 RepID=A0A3P9B2J7_9CICH